MPHTSRWRAPGTRKSSQVSPPWVENNGFLFRLSENLRENVHFGRNHKIRNQQQKARRKYVEAPTKRWWHAASSSGRRRFEPPGAPTTTTRASARPTNAKTAKRRRQSCRRHRSFSGGFLANRLATPHCRLAHNAGKPREIAISQPSNLNCASDSRRHSGSRPEFFLRLFFYNFTICTAG